jgi:hypothetical protein
LLNIKAKGVCLLETRVIEGNGAFKFTLSLEINESEAQTLTPQKRGAASTVGCAPAFMMEGTKSIATENGIVYIDKDLLDTALFHV